MSLVSLHLAALRQRTLAICDGPHNPAFDDNLIVRAGLARSAADITDALRSRVRIRSGGKADLRLKPYGVMALELLS